MLSELADEYEESFGCVWDVTPWGDRWTDVLKRAHAVDVRHEEADARLDELVGAFTSAVGFLKGRGLDPFAMARSLSRGSSAGSTLPEALLFLEIVGEDGSFRAAHAVVQEVRESYAHRQRRGAGNAVSEPAVVRFVDHLGTRTPDRALRFGKHTVASTGNSWRGVVVELPGPPPRCLTAWDRWRRAFLVEALTWGPVSTSRLRLAHGGATGLPKPFSDRAIAVASLLCGAVHEHWRAGLRTTRSMVAAERNAVAVARRRQSVSALAEREAAAAARDELREWEKPIAADVPTRPAPMRIRSTDAHRSTNAYRAAERALEREYRRTFGTDWDTPPWGRSGWRAIIPKALELDYAYKDCMSRLDRVIAASAAAREFLSTHGLDVDAPVEDEELAVGRSLPEYFLGLALTAGEGVVGRAATRLRELTERIRSTWNLAIVEIVEPEKLVVGDEDVVRNTVLASRGLTYAQAIGQDGSLQWSGWRPGIAAPPPESLRSDTHEWRRWFVATVLEQFDCMTHRRHKGATAVETDLTIPYVVKDRSVAVVSLLAGGLEMYSVAELEDIPFLIETERRAVALARKRARRRLAANWKL